MVIILVHVTGGGRETIHLYLELFHKFCLEVTSVFFIGGAECVHALNDVAVHMHVRDGPAHLLQVSACFRNILLQAFEQVDYVLAGDVVGRYRRWSLPLLRPTEPHEL